MTASPYLGPERRWAASFLSLRNLAVPYVGRDAAIRTISRSVIDRSQVRVAFCNANTLLLALRDDRYARILERFLVLNDGIGIDLASRLLNRRPFEHNLNGTDFVPDLLAACPSPLSIYLLGAGPDIARQAAERLARDHPRHTVVGFRDGYFRPDETDAVLAGIKAAAPDMLLVAMGNPLQEIFIHEHGARLDVPVMIAVGALFDFLAGAVPRAPLWMRRLRLEWLFRLLNEPVRLFRRYTVDLVAFLVQIVRLRRSGGAQPPTPPRSRLRPEP